MCADAALQVLLAARTTATAMCMCPHTNAYVFFLQGQVWRRELGYLLQNCALCLLPGHSLSSLLSSDKKRDFLFFFKKKATSQLPIPLSRLDVELFFF